MYFYLYLVKERKLKEQVKNGKNFIELLTACIEGPIHALTPVVSSEICESWICIHLALSAVLVVQSSGIPLSFRTSSLAEDISQSDSPIQERNEGTKLEHLLLQRWIQLVFFLLFCLRLNLYTVAAYIQGMWIVPER